jgi:ComF family protein
MGELYGQQLAESSSFIKPDLIIPVPLHPKKLKLRGYNQSACIAEGLSLALDIPVSINTLCRNLHTETQTRKSRFARYENMQEAFVLKDGDALNQKHILLVDDVVTTGSTLEACALCLQEANVRISLACLAYAE